MEQQTNIDGNWVPAIPEPFYFGWIVERKICDCKKGFWKLQSYKEHYLYHHIMNYR